MAYLNKYHFIKLKRNLLVPALCHITHLSTLHVNTCIRLALNY